MDIDGELPEDGLSAQEADNQALEKIMALVSSQPQALPPPPDAAAAAESFLASLKEEGEHQAKQKSRRRDR